MASLVRRTRRGAAHRLDRAAFGRADALAYVQSAAKLGDVTITVYTLDKVRGGRVHGSRGALSK
jgi:hypothetical protein